MNHDHKSYTTTPQGKMTLELAQKLMKRTTTRDMLWMQIRRDKYAAYFNGLLFEFHFDQTKPCLTCNQMRITDARWQLLPLYDAIKKQIAGMIPLDELAG